MYQQIAQQPCAAVIIFVCMQKTKWLTALTALLFLGSHFFPWLLIESKQIMISGLDATGTRFGKPGLLSLSFITLFFLLNFIPRNWAHRACIILAALNVGWTVRNFTLLSMCYGGECPVRQAAFYVYLITGLLLILLVLLQPVKLKVENEESPTV